ncbi:hypothetical protein [Massilia endophytica]|uniref:hypothetical protein n=1 Tax=Massilia endophytica TaxID=2899220 RepID=UPI001E412F82|nr:hypothetical protein [Massilia endophytica]UGQ49097.1 hypothetical protein LSQ66_11725 [Massilia endophytica]
MNKPSASNPRLNTWTATVVRSGLYLQAVAGTQEAARYLTQEGISPAVIQRVLGARGGRRAEDLPVSDALQS